ncbi:helix-turn-helix domain-containing protein [Streptomyces sp. NBC_01220]|uniref:Helix-turn-helix domain-containing protein n=1 Tax=Streptomyces poriferorum TaxID=2798799 RepID=A0ABY9IIE9_9ACTN|nr:MULTISPECIES: helix-turn-helix domain-containing protein [Streptomyces]WSQ42228.1 helix-turn-helix domain-containing protein [Streptomyces sp. NBC_01220]MBW5248036.1 helix-turn-helix domain-containing protein [Streptomyces poriferorum]MBW5255852.1 helix-turn-helix domain-containing protein [Streptomyces poriferorum]MDP5316559.1 helix-turn-helix domain-containing protein [Streptomyces sp. Alt4]WLQ54865.1 helix-turn-helix domain-containing protein [Streptomyces sp. Alt2]
MPHRIHPSDADDPLGPLPQEFAAIMRPELPSLIKEIGVEVTRAYPVYARLLDGPNGQALRVGVEQSLASFVDLVAEPSTSTSLRDDMCRRFGRFEAYEGRSMEALQGAYRLGARVALRRAKKVGRSYSFSPALMLSFADALFAYVDELESLSREGFLEVQSQSGEQSEATRRRLLHLILAGRPVPRTAIAELCEQTGWPLPEQVTLVAARAPAGLDRVDADRDMLVDLSSPQPHLLIPGPLDEARRQMLERALIGTRVAIGPTVPTAQASDSIRWARRVLELIDSGVIDDAPLALCENHLVTLWLLSDPALLDQLAQRELAPISGITATRRDRLIETLRIWLDTRGTAAHMGALLEVHPQTVRYRMRNLETIFGEQLTDPESRFSTEAVLRALQLRSRSENIPR